MSSEIGGGGGGGVVAMVFGRISDLQNGEAWYVSNRKQE